jgi:L-serine dehydratase
MYRSLQDAVRDAEQQGVTLARVALAAESADSGRPVDDIRAALARALAVMRGAVAQGLTGDLRSSSGLVGGDAAKLVNGPPGPLAGTPFRDVLARALAVQEVNAAMGVIVAAPTAGGAGVLPAVLTGLADARGIGEAASSTRSPRRGSSARWSPTARRSRARRAAARRRPAPRPAWRRAPPTEMLGGTPRQALHAVALAQQGTLGLVCDPLGGLVELPCVFRNATGRPSRWPRSRWRSPASSSRSPPTR